MKLFRFIPVCAAIFAITAGAGQIEVKTSAPENQTAIFQFRVPKGYQPKRRESYRVLVIFGGRNTDGKADATGRLGWGEWCDANGIFLVAPGFKNDKYWEPQEWSGKALLQALRQLKKSYNICTTKILLYGYSAGSQASNLFAAWDPSGCRAWGSHACGVFHEPTTRMRNLPGLVTCGDADTSRYIISREFVDKCREKGIRIVWKSFPNHPHDLSPDALKLARAFLEYYHKRYRDDLTGRLSRPAPEPAAFIGDDQEQKFYPENSAKAKNILPEDRVFLPNRSIAEAWGRAAE